MTASAVPAALAIDDLLVADDVAEVLNHLAAALPADLMNLAATAAVQADAAARASAGARAAVRPADVPGWLRLGALSALVSHVDGTAATCLHAPGPWDAVQATAWRLGVVACLACTHLFRVTGTAAHTCDGCGRVALDADADERITVVMLTLGGLIFKAGVCADCLPDHFGRP